MYYPNVVYHIYNQSNNKEVVFKNERDYLTFEEKMRTLLLPVLDILCYCLMPTHFHILALPKQIGCQPKDEDKPRVQQIHLAFRSLLSSYTQKTNLRYDRRGSLFRAKTKYKPGYEDFIPDDFELKLDTPFTRFIPYLAYCFRYIHNNPVKAGLADTAFQWAYCSGPDYASLRDNGICNYELTERLLGIRRIHL